MIQAADILNARSCEVSLGDHCNLSCRACNHASPHLPERSTPVETIERDLNNLSRSCEFDELRLAGGEPLTHPDLLDVVRVAKESGIAKKITLITNGVLLHRIPDGIWELIDRLWITVYPGVRRRFDEQELRAECHRHGVSVWLRRTSSFQLSLVNRRLSDRLIRFIYRHCSYAHDYGCAIVHEGRLYKCAPAAFMEQRLALLGLEFQNKERDGVALHDNPDLRQELEQYLADSKSPFSACSYCLGSIGNYVDCQQLDARGLESELADRNDRPLSLLSVLAIARSLKSRAVRKSGLVGILERRHWGD